MCAIAVPFELHPATAATPLRNLSPRGKADFDHGAFSSLLARFVKRGGDRYNRVDYRSFKQSGRAELASYLTALQAVDPTSLGREEAHAYWTNLYNAKTLDIVLEHYPVSSIKKIDLGGGGFFKGGPWSKKLLSVNGTALSLDDIENRIVRPVFADEMSHYGLNCASYSCPNLAATAYTGHTMSAMLSQGAQDYINHKRGLSISAGRITASKIYSWYVDDFGGKSKLKPHWVKYVAPDLASGIDAAEIGSYAYDWSLNDI